MNLILYGTSYKTAPLEVREQFSLSEYEIVRILPEIASLVGVEEALILSTCNRTEIYLICEDGVDINFITAELHRLKGSVSTDNHFYCLKDLEAAAHLFRVAASLEAQMVGETQIQNQIRQAYSLAGEAKTTGIYLNKLFHTAFRVGKEVRTKTNLGLGSASISGAAVELASHIYEKLDSKNAMLIGAGETGELVAKHLLDRGVASLKIANRTRAKADELAQKYNAVALDFESITKEIFNTDIVISATSSREYVITDEMIKPYVEKGLKRIVIIDIAIPRNIEPSIAKYENIFLYDMDDLNVIVSKNIERRKNEIPQAEKIVAGTVKEYAKWLKGQRIVPTIKFLRDTFEEIRTSELRQTSACRECDKRHEMDYLTKRIIQKILHTPITKLVENTDCTEAELEHLRRLFDRENKENSPL